MMKTTSGRRVDTVFVLIIFSVFALSVLMVLMLGASIYRNMTDIADENKDESTIISYVWTKVKSSDRTGSIYIKEHFGQNALCIDNVYDDSRYTTIIYIYEGWLYELFSERELIDETDPELAFMPADGVRVMEIGELNFEAQSHGLIRVSSGALSMLIYPRSSRGSMLF